VTAVAIISNDEKPGIQAIATTSPDLPPEPGIHATFARDHELRRCRMHGGAPGSGGPKGPRNGNYKHGRYTAEAIVSRRWLRDKTREVRALTKMLRDQR
jgi:hypothetical protein